MGRSGLGKSLKKQGYMRKQRKQIRKKKRLTSKEQARKEARLKKVQSKQVKKK